MHVRGVCFGNVGRTSIGRDKDGKPYLIDYSDASREEKPTTYEFAGAAV